MIELGDQTEWQENKLEYLRYEYPIEKGDRIADIGSYLGEFSKTMTKKYGAVCEMYDPLTNYAIGRYNGTIKMGGHFYYTTQYDKPNKEYKIRDAKEVLTGEYKLVKINIEGMEYDLLDYLIELDMVKNFEYLQIQFHITGDIDYISRYNTIIDNLKKTHIQEWCYPFVWESWKRI